MMPSKFAAHSLPTLRSLPQPLDMPTWELEYICHGQPFRAYVKARNVQAADNEGRIQLVYACPEFDHDTARLVRAIQTS